MVPAFTKDGREAFWNGHHWKKKEKGDSVEKLRDDIVEA